MRSSSNSSLNGNGHAPGKYIGNRYQGTPAWGMESGCLGTPCVPDLAPWVEAAHPGAAEAAAAAERIRSFAADEVAECWSVLRQEFNVQLLIWSSPAAHHFGETTARPEAEVRRLIEAALELAATRSGEAACLLREALARDGADAVLNRCTRDNVCKVVEAQQVADMRFALVASLEHAGQPGYVPEKHLEAEPEVRIAACDLGDLGLEYRVRRVLGLSLGDLRDRWKHYRHVTRQSAGKQPR